MQLELVREINLFEEKETMRALVRASLMLALVFLVLVPLLALVFYQIALKSGNEKIIDFPLVFITVLIVLISLPVHELVHGLFFKLFAPRGTKIEYGYKNGTIYATAPGVRFSRTRFIIIVLAPFVVLTLVYIAIGLTWNIPLTAYLCFATHTTGCVGDFFYVREIMADRRISVCEDTDTGVRFYAKTA